MPPVLSVLVASLFAMTTHCLPLTAGETRVAPGQPQLRVARASGPVKRDLSLNQDLKTLSNMLIALEYQRIQQNHRNREFLRGIGKRGFALNKMAAAAAADDGDDVVADLVAADPLGELSPGVQCLHCGEGESYGTYSLPVPLALLRLLKSP